MHTHSEEDGRRALEEFEDHLRRMRARRMTETVRRSIEVVSKRT